MPLGIVASTPRLVFISQTLALADVKTMIEGTGSESQAKTELAAPERKDRIAKQKARLTGLTLQNEFERWHYSQKSYIYY